MLGSDFAARAAALAERATSDRPPAWMPEGGHGHPQTVAGILLRYEQGRSAFGERTIAIIKTVEQEWAVWLHGAVLQGEFREQRPVPGELIAIRYLGRRVAKNPQPGSKGEYEAYRLVVDREVAVGAADAPVAPICGQCGRSEGDHAPDCIPF